MYSAIKVKGQKLYNLARDGQTIERLVKIDLKSIAYH
jgi:tRNA U55 pseudouridine synthase TruB